ncbi:MAG: arsenate reductase (glutaredoxin) [Rhodospirillaceae bacterium]|nr:arsenate reductase (glutaredoxin) [Rhodospirillaceae bacterium]
MTQQAVTIYHNPRCTKSRDTLALLENHGVTPKIVEYLKTPPSAAELKAILAALGLTAAEIARKKEAAEAGVDLRQAEDALIAAMVANPIVIERPIVVAGTKAVLGRPPENVLKLLA